jgi:hypothetical protein
MYSTSYSCQILMELEFSQQIFKKFSNTNFMRIHPVEVNLLPADKQMERHDETISHFLKFCKYDWNGRLMNLTEIIYIYWTHIRMINTMACNCTSHVIILFEHSNASTSHSKGLGSMPGQCMWKSVVDGMSLGRVWSQSQYHSINVPYLHSIQQ